MQSPEPRVSTIAELLRRRPVPGTRGRLFIAMDAYIDESGIHDGATALCVAGYWASPRPWAKFDALWCRAVRAGGFHLHQMHANRFFRRADPFHLLSDAQYLALERALLDAITVSKIRPVVSTLIVADFWHRTEAERRFLTGATLEQCRNGAGGRPSRPYFLPFHSILETICGSHTPAGAVAEFTWGVDRPAFNHACDIFHQLHVSDAPGTFPTWRDRLGESHHRLARQTPSLHAADFLAYLAWTGAEAMLASGATSMRPDLEPFGRQRVRALANAKSTHDFLLLDAAALTLLTEPLLRL
jgi:hypothetical protein